MSINELEVRVNREKNIMANNVVLYPLWVIYYYEFIKLKKLSIKKCSSKINKLADILGDALVNANIDFLVCADQEKYQVYVQDVKDELSHSKKYELIKR